MQRGLLTDFAQLLHNFFRPLAFLLNGTEHFRLTVKQTTGRSILKRNTDLSSGSLTGFRRLLFLSYRHTAAICRGATSRGRLVVLYIYYPQKKSPLLRRPLIAPARDAPPSVRRHGLGCARSRSLPLGGSSANITIMIKVFYPSGPAQTLTLLYTIFAIPPPSSGWIIAEKRVSTTCLLAACGSCVFCCMSDLD
jgi:hypothetical protein